MTTEAELSRAQKEAYTMENMAAHGAAGNSVTYIGTVTTGNRLADYYKDSSGRYWFRERIRLPNGVIVSQEEAIFGRKLKGGRRIVP